MQICIFDIYGIFFRSFFALPKFTTVNGIPSGAVFGTFRILVNNILINHGCRYAVALDGAGKTFREDIYPAYKQNRKDPPDELKPQFAILDEGLSALGISAFRVVGHEADDIIATLVHNLQTQAKGIKIFTTDKDMLQLVSPTVICKDPIKQDEKGMDYVKQTFGGLLPSQLPYYQALVGDSSDNVPGIKGIGPKAAQKLLTQYGSLSNIPIDIIQNQELLNICQQLVTLNINVPTIPTTVEQLNNVNLQSPKFIEFLEKYQLNKVLQLVQSQVSQKTKQGEQGELL